MCEMQGRGEFKSWIKIRIRVRATVRMRVRRRSRRRKRSGERSPPHLPALEVSPEPKDSAQRSRVTAGRISSCGSRFGAYRRRGGKETVSIKGRPVGNDVVPAATESGRGVPGGAPTLMGRLSGLRSLLLLAFQL